MWKLFLFSIVIILFGGIQAIRGESVRQTEFNYWLSADEESWATAYAACKGLDMDLVSPLNPVLNDALRQFMLTEVSFDDIWIGLTVRDGQWWWPVPNQPLVYSDFYNNGSCRSPSLDACGVAFPADREGSRVWGWCGRACTERRRFVCQVTRDPVTTTLAPSTMTSTTPTPTSASSTVPSSTPTLTSTTALTTIIATSTMATSTVSLSTTKVTDPSISSSSTRQTAVTEPVITTPPPSSGPGSSTHQTAVTEPIITFPTTPSGYSARRSNLITSLILLMTSLYIFYY